MSYIKNWLQFFADGGAPAGEGDGAATGVDSGIPGQSLEDLGVPPEKAEKFRQRRKSKPSAEPEASEAPVEQGEAKPAMSWDDFMAIPENNERMQRTMSERINRVARESNEYMEKLSPALDLLATKYGITPGEDGRFDPEAPAFPGISSA